ncbi:Malectin-like carbohydrate-binding protein [Parasponia andersonii]|uniref:Malectin-like carbohydrate-binding protein n=1 Tax=Parasponia andersonii TaxID=3476 RepID=A0A2P5DW78_PARAD|nr:Malectin-like carbohydrate-binding protein [Parasponia andersonii]
MQTPSTNSISGSLNQSLQIYTKLPNIKVGIYMTIYFSEVTQLPSTQKRSFQLFIDGKAYSTPIVPPFGSVKEIYITNLTASSDTLFELRPTADSTLSPLINANEIYSLSVVSSLGTNPADVEGLATVQMQFEILQIWSGDPCLQAKYRWEWVECSSGPTPRVTALNLSDFGLFGSLPDFSSMDALVSIDMHNNSLYGPIPDFLGNLTKLKQLDLPENRFNGTLPASLSSNKNLKLVVTENCLSGMSCPPPPPPPPPPRQKTHKLNDNNPPPPPPLPLTAFNSSNDRQGQNNFNLMSGSKKSAELRMVLGAMVQFFVLAFLFFSF